jgi:uncharacterized protein (DUF362 family)
MKRRDFLKRGVTVGFVAGTAFTINPYKNVFGSPSSPMEEYDMVFIRGGDVVSMFDRAMEEYGGMRRVVQKGQTVVVKPNIGWDTSPEKGANTNPFLVKRIIEHCLSAGAKEVKVFDHTCNQWNLCYANSGIQKAVKDAGGIIVSGDSEKYYQEVPIANGKKMKSAKVHELILESDVFINVPVLKNHGGANLTIAMKNLMGVVWDREFWHANDLHQCIADFAVARKPDLNIVDAYRVMKRNGPRGVSVEDVVEMKSQIIAKDIVAIDTAATKLFGLQPSAVNYIGLAQSGGAGTMDLDKLKISRIQV